jgi:NTP pyrophosphatase (non-canonical NTP hydrolase)
MVSLDPQDTPQTIEGFQDRGDVAPLPWTVDESGEISRALGVNALETTIIVDRDGRIVYEDATSTDYETLRSELEEVL